MTKIGIMGTRDNDKYGVNANYLEWIMQFGNPLIITPCDANDFGKIYNLDAMVLPGGADLNTNRYFKTPDLNVGSPNPFLEWFDVQILPIIVGKMPIFGICRGLQTLNVHFGGTLIQDLMGHPFSGFPGDLVHKVLNRGALPKSHEFKVNSFHHQAILGLGKDLKIEMVADDGTIEAISNFAKRIFAVQWHPERMWDRYSIKQFEAILR